MSRYTITIEREPLSESLLETIVTNIMESFASGEKGFRNYEDWRKHYIHLGKDFYKGYPLEIGPLPDGSVIKVEKEQQA